MKADLIDTSEVSALLDTGMKTHGIIYGKGRSGKHSINIWRGRQERQTFWEVRKTMKSAQSTTPLALT